MQTKHLKYLSVALSIIGLALTLAACNVKSDAPTSLSSAMTDDEMVTLIWQIPDSAATVVSRKFDKAAEENPNMTVEEEQTLVKQLLAEQMAKLPEDERAALQQKLREDSESQNQ